MRSLASLLALMVGGGCAAEADRVAPWREPGLLHEKTTWQQVSENDKEMLKNSQPLPPTTGTAAPAPTPAAGTGAAAAQQLPSAGYGW